MKYGVCGDLAMASVAKLASFDYFEWNVGAFLQPRENNAAFAARLAEMRGAGIPCPVVNCFLPGDLRITGPDVRRSVVEAYARTTLERAREAGVEIIVFGSGGARQIPDGFDANKAHEQLASFGRMLAPLAQNHGVTIVLEPLNSADCNVLTTVSECAGLVREVNHPAFRLLVDSYHLFKENDSLEDVAENGELLAHVHIATVPNRLPPGAEPCDFEGFFEALRIAGYDGRISIEGGIPDPETDLSRALEFMRGLET